MGKGKSRFIQAFSTRSRINFRAMGAGININSLLQKWKIRRMAEFLSKPDLIQAPVISDFKNEIQSIGCNTYAGIVFCTCPDKSKQGKEQHKIFVYCGMHCQSIFVPLYITTFLTPSSTIRVLSPWRPVDGSGEVTSSLK